PSSKSIPYLMASHLSAQKAKQSFKQVLFIINYLSLQMHERERWLIGIQNQEITFFCLRVYLGSTGILSRFTGAFFWFRNHPYMKKPETNKQRISFAEKENSKSHDQQDVYFPSSE
ncbi:hypothetical protein L9F63_011589, partial [Diploptera punctata]